MMSRIDGQSLDNVRARIKELKKLFPESVSEGRLDYDTLMALLGDEFDNDSEKYQFTWKGKLDSLRLAQKRSTATLRPCQSESVDWDTTKNLYIEGDNLEVLKLLQQGYLRKVKLIYIDPPYNTGNDFVYEDDFTDPIGQYRAQTGQALRANPETAGRYHSKWLSMMYPRLKIAKTLLRDDGVIFISIDDNEQHNMRKLCDEVFGEECFIASFIWKSRQNKDNRNISGVSIDHEYIICYARKSGQRIFRGTDRKTEQYTNPDNDPRGKWTSANMVGLATADERPNLHYDLINESTGVNYGCPAKGWRYDRNTMQRLIAENRILWPDTVDGRPRKKSFLNELSDNLPGFSSMIEEGVYTNTATKELLGLFDDHYFDFPKPSDLLMQIFAQTTEPNDLILDFFSGSATTAHAVMQLNADDKGMRHFILVQIPETTEECSSAHRVGFKTICDIGKERIRRAGAKIREQAGLLSDGLDTGFRVFKLDSSNLKEWDDTWAPEDLQTELLERFEEMLTPIKPDRRAVDVVYEVYLKYGIELTEPLAHVDVGGKTFYVVGEKGDLLISIDKDLTEKIVEQAATTYAPGTMIFARDSFADSNEIANVQYILEKHDIEFRWI